MLASQALGGDGRVVEIAEAAGQIVEGMVARAGGTAHRPRPHRQHDLGGMHGGPGTPAGAFPAPVGDGAGGVGHVPARLRHCRGRIARRRAQSGGYSASRPRRPRPCGPSACGCVRGTADIPACARPRSGLGRSRTARRSRSRHLSRPPVDGPRAPALSGFSSCTPLTR